MNQNLSKINKNLSQKNHNLMASLNTVKKEVNSNNYANDAKFEQLVILFKKTKFLKKIESFAAEQQFRRRYRKTR